MKKEYITVSLLLLCIVNCYGQASSEAEAPTATLKADTADNVATGKLYFANGDIASGQIRWLDATHVSWLQTGASGPGRFLRDRINRLEFGGSVPMEKGSDTLSLLNGGFVSGTLTKYVQGKVHLDTLFAGTLIFDRSSISGISSSSARLAGDLEQSETEKDVIILIGGDRVDGELLEIMDGKAVIKSELGDVKISMKRIEHIHLRKTIDSLPTGTAMLVMNNVCRIPILLKEIRDNKITGTLISSQEIKIDLKHVSSIEFNDFPLYQLQWVYYEKWTRDRQSRRFPRLDEMQYIKRGIATDGKISSRYADNNENWGLGFKGKLAIPCDGEYFFIGRSEGDFRMYLDGKPVLQSNLEYGERYSSLATVYLEAGVVDFEFQLFMREGYSWISLMWIAPGRPRQFLSTHGLINKYWDLEE